MGKRRTYPRTGEGPPFTVRFNRTDIVELRHAFEHRGDSHARDVIFKTIERVLRKSGGKIFTW